MLDPQSWNDPSWQLPASVTSVTTMLAPEEQRLLYWLTREWFTGKGAICDLGAYLGGSTVCFAQGLREWGCTRRGYLYTYDMFTVGNFERTLPEFAEGLPEHNSTVPLFMKNLEGLLDLLIMKVGDVARHHWPDNGHAKPDHVEILFVDVAKGFNTWDHVVKTYFPWLIPGHSLVIVQDYMYEKLGQWPHVVMERLAPYFDRVVETAVGSSIVFQLTKPIPPAEIEASMWEAIPPDERRTLMERAVERAVGEHDRQIMEELLARLDERSRWQYNPSLYGHVTGVDTAGQVPTAAS